MLSVLCMSRTKDILLSSILHRILQPVRYRFPWFAKIHFYREHLHFLKIFPVFGFLDLGHLGPLLRGRGCFRDWSTCRGVSGAGK